MSRSFTKVGVILLLLLLLVGPVLQAFDCFNDAPNLDHDGLLHGIDALLCVAFTLLLFRCLLLVCMKLLHLLWQLPRQVAVSLASLQSAAPFPPVDLSRLELRI